MTPELKPLRRIAAYAVCTDSSHRVLLVRHSPISGTPGVWSLPGGAVDHGEHPSDTVVRETAAETGLSVAVGRLRDVLADLRAVPHRGVTIHTDRLIYEVTLRGRQPADPHRPADRPARLVQPAGGQEPAAASVHRGARSGCRPRLSDPRPDQAPELPSFLAVPGKDGLHRAQRFAAYAVATDPGGSAAADPDGAPASPARGDGTCPAAAPTSANSPPVALLRELAEETGQQGRVEALLGVASHRDAASLGPEGYPIDWHGVRAFYRVTVDQPERAAGRGPGRLDRCGPLVPPAELASCR